MMMRQNRICTILTTSKRKIAIPYSNFSFHRCFSTPTAASTSTTITTRRPSGLFLWNNNDNEITGNNLVFFTSRTFSTYNNTHPHDNHNTNNNIQPTSNQTSHENSKPIPNPGLHSVIDEGLTILKSISSDIQSKTKRRLLLSDEDTGPSPEQLRESVRIKQFMEDAIEIFTSRKGNLFCVMKEPIIIVDVEITQDLRQARVFWSLPYGVLLMDGISAETRMRAAERMQRVLDERGGVLQGLVHQKMRGYFRPPKIRFVMAEGEMLRRYLKELL
jgi:hypothetical protein